MKIHTSTQHGTQFNGLFTGEGGTLRGSRSGPPHSFGSGKFSAKANRSAQPAVRFMHLMPPKKEGGAAGAGTLEPENDHPRRPQDFGPMNGPKA